MRWIVLVLCGVLVGCGGPEKAKTGAGEGSDPFPAAQKIIDAVAADHPNVERLTLHAVPTGKSGLTQLASTMASRRGKPSDPEDLQAMEDGEVVVLDEPGALDVTVPILVEEGTPTAIAGVTLTMEDDADREDLIDEARAIAEELEREIRAADGPVW